MASHLKTNFAVDVTHEAFFTGGNVQLTQDGSILFCSRGNQVQALEISTGKVIGKFGETEDEEITCFALSKDDEILVLATRNLLLRQWDWKNQTLTRSWKAIHTAPVTCMLFDETATLLVTGSSDSTIKIWDIVRKYCTHNLRGHSGIVRVLRFHPDGDRLELYSGGDDNKIRVWELKTSSCSHVLDTHYSVVTSLVFSQDQSTLISAGRDSIIAVWSVNTFQLVKTIPVFETVESLFILPEDRTLPELNKHSPGLFVVTAGSKGYLRVWNIEKSQCVYSQERIIPASDTEDGEQEQIITQALYNTASSIITVITYDHNILQFDDESFKLMKQFAGYNDEVLDVEFLGHDDTHLAVITNSNQVKVFEVTNWTCQILYGHTDIVLCIQVDKTSQLFVTSSKDNSIRLWKLDSEKSQVTCIAVGYGHTHAVGSVSFSRFSSSFIVSGSQDCTLKVWDVPTTFDSGSGNRLVARLTEKAHDKDINSVTVAPNDKLIASGSQDRTIKLWDGDSLKLLGVMRGHKRGVWCVQFSPVDQCLASSSGDGTIKIWALSDFSCVKTFEGHDSSVLKVVFLSRGMQLMSSGSDGLIKLWTIKASECIKTFDEHEDKVWALAVSKKQNVAVSGAGDSKIIFWKDVSQTELDDLKKTQEEFILQEQELSNLIQQKKYLKAIRLAITLDQPFRLLNILKNILESPSGQTELEAVLSKLRPDQIDSVLRFATKWNTNSRHCHVAQLVISVILRSIPLEELSKLPNIKSTVEGLLPYTERHYQRLSRIGQQSTFVEYTWHNMRAVTTSSSHIVDQVDSHAEDRPVFIPYVPPQRVKPVPEETALIKPDLGLLIRQRVQQRNKEKLELELKTSDTSLLESATINSEPKADQEVSVYSSSDSDEGIENEKINNSIIIAQRNKELRKVKETESKKSPKHGLISSSKQIPSKAKLKSSRKSKRVEERIPKVHTKIRKKSG